MSIAMPAPDRDTLSRRADIVAALKRIAPNGVIDDAASMAAYESDGLTAYRSLGETPDPVDYAYIAISAAQVAPLLEQARGRVRYAQVISSGFGEVDEGKIANQE